MQAIRLWICALILAGVTACGGDGGGGGNGGNVAPLPATRIDAGPQAVLLGNIGDSRALSAQLRDANGAPATGTVTWSSSDPAVVSVDSAGTVRAMTAAGSARVTAASGALQSSAILVTIAQPVAGAQLLADSQIVSGPTAVDPAAAPAAGNAYEIVVRGVPALPAGTILISREAANVAGRVVSSQPDGANQRVRLVVVPPKLLFSAFDFSETVDLTQGPFEIPAELAASHDVVQNGSTFTFTPKPGASAAGAERVRAHAATGTTALPPLPPFRECEVSAGFGSGLPMPLALSTSPAFEVTIDGTARREANAQGTRFIVTGNPKFKLSSTLEIKSAFEAKIGCKLTLIRRQFRVPGWAGLFFGGDIEFGVGFEVGGKVTLFNAKVGGTATLNTTLGATLNCPAAGGNCTLDGNASAQTELSPVLQAPALNQAQFEPSVNLFAFVTLEAGNADIQQLQFTAIEIKAGAELAAGLTAEALQIDNVNPDTGRSKYALALKSEVGPGVKLGEFLTFLGLADVIPLKLSFSFDLGGSPSATSVTADRPRYLPGERAAVTVNLAPATTLFPNGGVYNVERVQLRRKSGLLTTELLAEQTAVAGQASFALSFDSPALLDAGEIFAFLITKFPPLIPLPAALELAAARTATASVIVRVAPVSVNVDRGGSVTFSASVTGSTDQRVIWELPEGGGTITQTGVFTAGNDAGGFTVLARSVADPSRLGGATVIVGRVVRVTGALQGGIVSAGRVSSADSDPRAGTSSCAVPSISSSVGEIAWSRALSCDIQPRAGISFQPSSASATTSFTESYVNGDLVAVTASSNSSATGPDLYAGGGGTYILNFDVLRPTTFSINAQLNSGGGRPCNDSRIRFFPSGWLTDVVTAGSVNQTLTLIPGNYMITTHAGACIRDPTGGSVSSTDSASFSLSLTFTPAPL